MKAFYGYFDGTEMDWNQITGFVKGIGNLFSSPLFSGIAGAILAVIWHRPDILMILFYLGTGIASAGWGVPPIMEWQKIGNEWACLLSFVVGGFAGSFASMVFNFLRSGKAQEVLADFLRRRK